MALEVKDLTVRHGSRQSGIVAVDGVSLEIPDQRTLGLVGESGSGKSTLARAIVSLVKVSGGRVLLDGNDVTNPHGEELRLLRGNVQMVFQDPSSSLNPRMTVGQAIDEAVQTTGQLSRGARSEEVERLLHLVAMDADSSSRFPHEFSVGQRQRLAIARSLAARPSVLILDEVTSALDMSVQATILNLLVELQRTLQLSYLYISHDLSVVQHMSDRVSVMYLGRIVEHAPTEALFSRPRHPYTKALIDAIPRIEAHRAKPMSRLAGEIPNPRDPPSGCRFHPRCPVGPLFRTDRARCLTEDPHASQLGGSHVYACHFPLESDESEGVRN